MFSLSLPRPFLPRRPRGSTEKRLERLFVWAGNGSSMAPWVQLRMPEKASRPVACRVAGAVHAFGGTRARACYPAARRRRQARALGRAGIRYVSGQQLRQAIAVTAREAV